MTAAAEKTPGKWIYSRPEGEPPFWMRDALPHEIDGFDPLTGCIIAHSLNECERLDRAAKATGEGS